MAKPPKSSRRSTAEFLLRIREAGVPLPEAHKSHIRSAGLADELKAMDGVSFDEDDGPKINLSDDRYHLWIYPEQKEVHIATYKKQHERAKANLEKALKDGNKTLAAKAEAQMRSAEHEMRVTQCYYDRIPQEWKDKWADREITANDWMVEDIMEAHADPEFREFWDSHIPAMCNLLPYEKFYLYLEQSRRQIATRGRIEDHESYGDQLQWSLEQIEVGRWNTMYVMDADVWIKEAQMPGGKRKYKASIPQALWLYAFDCKFSSLMGKGRQAAATSTAAPAGLIKSLSRTNSRTYFAADDVESKGQGLFDDKIKWIYQNLPVWWQAESAANFSKRELTLDFAPGDSKSQRRMVASHMEVVSAQPTALNSKTPDITMLDEATDMPYFGKIMYEVAPTMMYFAPDGRLRRSRQLIAWSTGTSSGKGKGQYEQQYMKLLDQWHSGIDTQGFLPIFYDWTCRPGMTREVYLAQQARYLHGDIADTKGMSKEESMAVFKSHYPSVPEDMFLASHKTILPMTFIQSMLDMARNLPEEVKPIRGYFEPIYDHGKPMPQGSPFPYFVRGANFVPADDDDPNAPVEMFMPPEPNWRYRYFQGTDPLMHEDGYSKMASAIKDRIGALDENGMKHSTISCLVNTKHNDLKWRYMQCILMGIYYRNYEEQACKEVVEANVGKPYTDMKEGPCFNLSGSLVLRTEMHEDFTGGSHIYGVDTKSKRKGFMLTRLIRAAERMNKRIPYYVFWSQVRTMQIEKTDHGYKYGTLDSRRYQDDVCDAIALAEMADEAFAHRPPEYVDPQVQKAPKREVIAVRNPVTLDIEYRETVHV